MTTSVLYENNDQILPPSLVLYEDNDQILRPSLVLYENNDQILPNKLHESMYYKLAVTCVYNGHVF